MKRPVLLLLAASLLLTLCACAGAAGAPEPSTAAATEPQETNQDLLTKACWLNIHDGDIYIFHTDGSGTHNGISVTYTLEGDQVSVTEGVAALHARVFRLDKSGPQPRLIPDSGDSFYVMEPDYQELAPLLRRESIQILLSYESWKVSAIDGYLTFYENGTGKLRHPAGNVNQDTTWEMVDNNTLRCHLPMDGTREGVNTLQIVNDNGQYRLLTDDPAVYYTPYGDPRPKIAVSSAIVSVDTGIGYTLCLKADGSAISVGIGEQGQRKIDKWEDLTAISGSNMHTAGLLADGTVIATGDNSQGQCNVSGWTNIAAVETGFFHTAALGTDGTAVAIGYSKNGQCDLQSWSGLTALSAGGYHTLGLKADGTVIAAGYNEDGRCDVSGWREIVAISGGGYHSVGLKADGTVVAVGSNSEGQCDVASWNNIVAVSAGEYHTVGLKADGTVVAVGKNSYNQCRVGAWCDIVSISAGGAHTAGLKADGTVLLIGNNDLGQCDADTLMKNAA